MANAVRSNETTELVKVINRLVGILRELGQDVAVIVANNTLKDALIPALATDLSGSHHVTTYAGEYPVVFVGGEQHPHPYVKVYGPSNSERRAKVVSYDPRGR